MQVIKVIIIVVLLLASMVGVILGSGYLADNNPFGNGHTHELTLVEATDPDCTTPGYRKHYSCKGCGEIFADAKGYAKLEFSAITIAPYGHNVKATSCTEDKYCETCNQVVEEALGHTAVVDVAVDATCTADGKTEGSHCSVCGEVIVPQTTVGAKGHTYDNITDYGCNKCSYVRDASECPHLAESLTAEVTPPTCTEEGYTTYVCTCDYLFVADQVPAKGHTEVTTEAVAAGCLASGLSEGKHCSECNTILVSQKPVAAKGVHTWNGLTCTDCNATKFEAEIADIVYVMPEGETRVVTAGREGKTPEATNYPSGDSFVYFMSYSDTTTLTFYITASKAGKATVSVRMGCATNAAELKNIMYVVVNGEQTENRPDVVFPAWHTVKYYDWLELEITDIELRAGENVIEICKPYTGEYTSKSGLNFDYMAICPEDPAMTLQNTRDYTAGAHSYTVYDVISQPHYTAKGELRVYCENCRSCNVIELPAISEENYEKISDDILTSVWEYTYDGKTYSFTVTENAQKYTFEANTERDPFATTNGGSVTCDGVATGLKTEEGHIFYANDKNYNYSYTLKIYVDKDTTVKFYVGAAKDNATLAPNKILQNLKVGGSTDGVTYSTTSIKWSDASGTTNWFIFQESLIATIDLKAGENIITFEVLKTSLNLDKVIIEARIPVELKKQTTEG